MEPPVTGMGSYNPQGNKDSLRAEAHSDDRGFWARVCCCFGGGDDVKSARSLELSTHRDPALLELESDMVVSAEGPLVDGTGTSSPSRPPKKRATTQYHDLKGKVLTLGDIRQNQVLKNRGGFKDQYMLGDMLARGGFGTTYLAVEKSTDRLVVVKVPDDKTDTDDFHKLKEKSHPHIVRVYECFQDDKGCHIVMEFCEGGDLFHAISQLMEKEGKVSTNWCAHVFRDVVDGCMYLHETFKQAHNDIKPENILLERPPEHGADAVRAMLGDFGLVCQYGGDFKEAEGSDGPAAGDPRYAAPELMDAHRKCRPNAESDIWSLGTTLFEMMTGKLPYLEVKNIKGWKQFSEHKGGKFVKKLLKRNDAMFKMKLREMCPEEIATIEDERARELVPLMLKVNEKKRCRLEFARNHAFMQLADDLDGNLHGRVHLPFQVVRAHAARGMFKLRLALLQIVESKVLGVPEYDDVLWSEADKDHNGVLTLDEFEKLWDTVKYPPDQKKPAAKTVFEIVDIDGDGTVSFDEFMTFEFDPKFMDEETREETFISAFRAIAGVGAEHIALEDLLHVFSAERAAVEDLFIEIDLDGDGKVSFEEFKAYIMNLSKDVSPDSFAEEAED